MARTVTLTEYFARAGSGFTDADARVIGPVLEELADAGTMTAEVIVDEARPEDSPLHPYFEWDDSAAAKAYRLDQARDLARNVVIERKTPAGPQRVPAFVHVQLSREERERAGLDRSGMNPYLPIERVVSDSSKVHQKIAEARRQLAHWRQTYGFWALTNEEFQKEFQPVLLAIQEAEERAS